MFALLSEMARYALHRLLDAGDLRAVLKEDMPGFGGQGQDFFGTFSLHRMQKYESSVDLLWIFQ